MHTNRYDYAAERPQIGGVDVREEEYRQEFRHLEFETEHPAGEHGPLDLAAR
ncbi:MAG TPA: hypothetical protein VIF35_05005 [Streptosporangiaceae bacterium]